MTKRITMFLLSPVLLVWLIATVIAHVFWGIVSGQIDIFHMDDK